MNLTTEITEAIQRNLPQQVGGEMKKLLTQAEQNERTLEALRIEYVEKEDLADELERQVDQLESDLKEANARAATAEELEKRQRNLKVYELEIQLKAERQISEHVREVNLALTRNLEYRKRCIDPPQVVGGDTVWQDGNEVRTPAVPLPGSESTSETVE